MLFCVVICYICIVYHVLGHSFNLNVIKFTIILQRNLFLSRIAIGNAIMYIHELPMCAYNLYMSCLHPNT